MLYAQSLRGGNTTSDDHAETPAPSQTADSSNGSQLPWWLIIPVGGAIASAAFWVGRRTSSPRLVPVAAGANNYVPDVSAHKDYPVSTPATASEAVSPTESPVWNGKHQVNNEKSGVNSQK